MIRAPTQQALRTPAPGRRSCSKHSASKPSSKDYESPGSPLKTSECCYAADAAEGLCRLVDAGYEKRSIAISSNLPPTAFDELMPRTLATATVDRLLHHAHIYQTTGDSVRAT